MLLVSRKQQNLGMIFYTGSHILVHPESLRMIMVIYMIADRSFPGASLLHSKEIGAFSGQSGCSETTFKSHLCQSDRSRNTIFDLLFNGYWGILFIKFIFIDCHILSLVIAMGTASHGWMLTMKSSMCLCFLLYFFFLGCFLRSSSPCFSFLSRLK